jgi:hypothetical protein
MQIHGEKNFRENTTLNMRSYGINYKVFIY